MRKIKLDSVFEEYDHFDLLSKEDQFLLNSAIEAAKSAYAPYSHFFVGAAVMLDNGEIVQGNNQENAAYPSGLCAERVAFFSTGAQHPNEKIKSIAVVAYPEGTEVGKVAVSPCGDCRQVMAEYEHRYGQKIRLIMQSGNGKFIVSESVSSLLPFAFDAESMK